MQPTGPAIGTALDLGGVEVALEPPAAVDEEQARGRPLDPDGRVDPHADLAIVDGDGAVFDVDAVLRSGVDQHEGAVRVGAALVEILDGLGRHLPRKASNSATRGGSSAGIVISVLPGAHARCCDEPAGRDRSTT